MKQKKNPVATGLKGKEAAVTSHNSTTQDGMSRGKSPAGHTPGPWAFIEGSSEQRASSVIHKANDPEFTIAQVNCEWLNKQQRAEDVANARLISVAPELYAACEKLLDASARGCPTPEKFLTEAIGLARIAVAKAEGR